MKVRIIYKPNKSVAIIHPVPNSRRQDETEKQWLERVFNKCMQGELKGLPYDDINSSELPQSREDRDAWRGEKDKGIHIDQTKAKEIRKEKEKQNMIKDKIREMAIKELEEEGKL